MSNSDIQDKQTTRRGPDEVTAEERVEASRKRLRRHVWVLEGEKLQPDRGLVGNQRLPQRGVGRRRASSRARSWSSTCRLGAAQSWGGMADPA